MIIHDLEEADNLNSACSCISQLQVPWVALLILAGSIICLNVCWQLADLSRPHLGQLGYLAPIHMSLILQKGSQTCFYGNDRGQGRRKLTMQVLFKPLFTSGLLTSYWLRQVHDQIQSQNKVTW